MMTLKLLVPGESVLEATVVKIIAEAQNGFFCLEPRHIDFVSALVPGIVSYYDSEGNEFFVATDEGVLVKCGDEVWVSTFSAVCSTDLATLKDTVQTRFKQRDEEERSARAAVARLEAGMVRRFVELEKRL